MSGWGKVAVVLAGYALAFVASGVAAWLYDRRVSSLPYDTSGGMYAFGEATTGLSVFLVAALVPTLLALWYLRRSLGLWSAVTTASLAFAVTGLLAVLMTLTIPDARTPGWLALVSLLGLGQLLGVPFWTVCFVLLARLAPTRMLRRRLVAAIYVELVIGVFALVYWLRTAAPV